jgi:hypothetical protein
VNEEESDIKHENSSITTMEISENMNDKKWNIWTIICIPYGSWMSTCGMELYLT